MAEVDLATLAILVKSEGAEAATQQLARLGAQSERTEQQATRLGPTMDGLLKRYASFAAILGTVSAAMVYSIGKASEQERALANLAANTGLAGNELQGLRDRLVEVSGSTGLTAVSLLDAAEALEGLVPGAAGSGAAIAAVTKEAALLARAAGIELPVAVEALGATLSQFGLDADQAARVTDVLVAAAQNGAASVPDLAQAFERVGPAANRAGLSVEQAVASVELLANRGIRGREATSGLSEVFNALAEAGDRRLHPALVGIDGALAELERRNLSASDRQKLFGESAARVADLLVTERDEVERLTREITGTDAAAKQAAIQMDTLSARTTQFAAAVENLGAEFGGNFTPYLKEATTAGTLFLEMLRDSIDFGEETTDVSKEFGVALRGVAFGAGAAVHGFAALVDTAIQVQRQFLNLGNFLTGDFDVALDQAARNWDEFGRRIYERLDEVQRAAAMVTNPDLLTTERAEAPAKGGDPDARANAERDVARDAAERERKAGELRAQAQAESFRDFLDQINRQSDQMISAQLDGVLREQEFMERVRTELSEGRLAAEIQRETQRREALGELYAEFADADMLAQLEYLDALEEAVQQHFDDQVLPNEEERKRRLEDVHRQRERAIAAISRDGIISRSQYEQMSERDRQTWTRETLRGALADMAQHNKAAFHLNKAAAIAEGVVSVYKGAAKAMELPFPKNLAAAAAVLAQGLQLVATIRSQNYGSDMGGGFSGGGGGLRAGGATEDSRAAQPAAAAEPAIDPRAQGQTGETRIYIVGSGALMTDGDVSDLMERLKDLVNSTDRTLFDSNSRQALDAARAL